MTILIDFDGPLPCPPVSFVVDPALADTVEAEYDLTAPAGPTGGPNRLTLHVPTETTRLSLGQPSSRWKTDKGITGYTDSHIHFETKQNDKTIVSLGGPATTTSIKGHGDVPPVSTQGYSMVTAKNAWHDARLQHYLLSQTADISLRTSAGAKRAVLQADHGKVDLNGGEQVNLSGGGVSIAAGELTIEDARYDVAWTGTRPHSSAASAAQIATAVAAAAGTYADALAVKVRLKFDEGNFAGAPAGWVDKGKWLINSGLYMASLAAVIVLVSEPTSPAKCVKMSAPHIFGAMAGGDISIFGVNTASVASAGWTTVSAGVSASLKGLVFGGVTGLFASMKGYRKVEMGSDWGKVFTGAETGIHLEGEKDFNITAKKVVHVASPEGEALFGSKKVWMGTPAGGGFGLILDDAGLAFGKASGVKDLASAKIEEAPALRITADTIELKTRRTSATLKGDACTMEGKNKKIRFEAGSAITLNGAKILLK